MINPSDIRCTPPPVCPTDGPLAASDHGAAAALGGCSAVRFRDGWRCYFPLCARLGPGQVR